MTDNGLTFSQQRRLAIILTDMDKDTTELQKALDYIAKALVKSQERATRLRRILQEEK